MQPYAPLESQPGGFLPGSQTSPSKGVRPPRDRQSLLPVTIRQLHTAQRGPDDNFVIDGRPLSQVSLVCIIRSVQEQVTQSTYVVDDGTGTIEVKIWTSSDLYIERKRPEWREGVYVRVFGHLRNLNDKLLVVAFRLQLVVDFNEITYHMLQAMKSVASSKQGQAVGSSTDAVTDGYSAVQMAVKETVVQYSALEPAGASRQAVTDALKTRFTPQQVDEAIAFLIQEGILYATRDDDHFKSTSE